MYSKSILKGLFALLFITTFSYAATSKIDELVKAENVKELVPLIKNTKIIEDETQLPDYPKENELIIIENEYDIKILFEYVNGEWSEKGGKLVADILNDQKSTYMHLFNYKVSNKDFNPYVSDKDTLKTTDTDKKISLKFIESKFNEKAINSNIKLFMQKNLLEADEIINIQIIPNLGTEQTNCKIILTYKE